ncbi:acyl-CoA reductase-like NAD-dependent aldehyde dehydrogenase [Mucilaginibacter lappiensis]|nr:acyl-CoA reductase-like NAD-dependent aldehyde dehydrogenase [Mucilaginibacter lappiensis]
MSIQTINPFNNKVVKSFEEMTPAVINAAIAQAENTFET